MQAIPQNAAVLEEDYPRAAVPGFTIVGFQSDLSGDLGAHDNIVN
jgi:hypothetical protein